MGWRVRYAGDCTGCGTRLAAGTEAIWDRDTRTLWCLTCGEPGRESVPVAVAMDVGVAGRSARTEYERRVTKHENAIEQRWGTGMAGRVVKALSTEPQTTRAWKVGADGEERLGEILDAIEGCHVLHDRRIPGSQANIDHIVLAPSGVYVIDAKNHRGTVRVTGAGLLGRREPRLIVDGRDCSDMAEGMQRQVAAVTAALGVGSPDVAAVLCFLRADRPLLDRPDRFRGIHLEGPRSVRRLLAREGPHTEPRLADWAALLGSRLPAR